jgi:hypothetical protein
LDTSTLSALIQPQHLDPGAVLRYRDAFESSAARYYVLEDFLAPELADRLSSFLRNEAMFETEFGLYSAEEHKVDEAAWLASNEADRFFRYGRLVGTPPEFQFSPNSLAYLQFRNAFRTDEDMRRFFEASSGLELAASDDFGSHSMGAGDFLQEHDDNNRNRRLALVLYLSPDWTAELGGSLHIVEPDGKTWVVPPTYNSLVAFDTHAGTTHFVQPILPTAGDARRVTIGGWYHTPVDD